MKYLIIGGVAGGASAAARLRRLDEQAEIIMFEKGNYVSYANCGLPYYIGDVIKERNKLFVQTPASFKERFNIDVRLNSEVTSINPAQKTINVVDLFSGNEYTEHYDKLVLSPGAEPVKPPLEGIDLPGIFTLRNVPDTDKIKEFAKKYVGGKAVIIGAGFIGLEMAENLHHLGMHVTIVEMMNQVMAPVDFPIAAIAQEHLRSKGIKLLLGKSVAGFQKDGDEISVLIKDAKKINADMVLLSIGVRPDTKLALGAGLEIGPSRGIKVNEYLQTSNPDIYAVGDAIEFVNPISGMSMNTYLAGPANKQGRLCADNIVMGNKHKYNGAINTAIVKVFDYTIATTGFAAKHLDKMGIPYRVSTTRSAHHATYFPGAQQLTIQIVFSPENGRLLGAQVAGTEGVDKRIDVFATLLRKEGTIYDLTEFEHAYAPPFSSAKDPVNMAGYVAENLMNNYFKVVYWNELKEKIEQTQGTLIDVRTVNEFCTGSINGAINIPVDNLREKLSELPKDQTYFLYCAIGLRGYIAQRIMRQSGFENVFNLSGGYTLWKTATVEMEKLS